MAYYFRKTLEGHFDDAIRRTTQALQDEGFGIITDIDIKDTLHRKLAVDFRNYRILGACNPKLAFEALRIEDKIGTMLPCNVVVQEVGENSIEVAAIDPVASMQAIDSPVLKEKAEHVRSMLRDVINRL